MKSDRFHISQTGVHDGGKKKTDPPTKKIYDGGEISMNKKMGCFAGGGKNASCCKVESLVSVDERGQMVLPKDLREKANIQAGDKLAVISWEKEGEICCFTLIKADSLAGGIRDFLGPMMQDLSKKETK
jgi:AbrB family looped-hinge helix DNA binding protein